MISLRTCFCSSVSAASKSSGPNGVISAGTGYCTRPRRAKRGSTWHPSERIWSKSLRKTFKVLQLRYLHRLPLVASASRNHLGLQRCERFFQRTDLLGHPKKTTSTEAVIFETTSIIENEVIVKFLLGLGLCEYSGPGLPQS